MIVSKKRNKTEDIFCSTLNLTFQHMRKHISRCSKLIAYLNLIRRCYAINFEHPISNFIKKSEVRSHEKGRLHEKYIPYSRPFMLFLSYYLFSFKV